ncbi:MAG: LysR family transcriptional regulator [Ruminiclostridium sp.]|nr:LysR family transcriptional regulator [Ruminiclostridium sp.]MBQ9853222.1 LysR family transcriptional regulator [Ruminiclostridium sp.]MBQ9933714.1 LysR family transcriptional regulator [Ruminiclostridium sp.]
MDRNLQKYLAFVKTVEYGSFTRAAELLNYSQSGVSRMIQDLEQEWKVTLLDRGRAGVKLTSEGIKLLPFAQSLCGEYEKLQAQVDELNGLQAGLIRIGTFASVATHWLPRIIRAFQKDYPGVDFELLMGDYDEIERWTLEGRVDCGFLRLPADPALETLPLARDDLVAILPEGHPLAQLEKIPLAALCQDPFILLEKGVNREVSELFRRYGLTPQVRYTLWEDYAVMAMVESGMGISLLHRLILKRTPYHFVARPLAEPAYRDIALALRSRQGASLAVQRFLDYLAYR